MVSDDALQYLNKDKIIFDETGVVLKLIIDIHFRGMSKEIQEKLFTQQVKSLSKARKENKGAGIGLLLVKGFLEKNNGEIWVESLEGEGSSFYFTLPVNKPLDKIDNTHEIEFDKND